MYRAAFLVAIILSCVLPVVGHAEDKIRIGVSTALTGNAALYGTDLKNTLLFANEKLTGNKYELVFEDDKCNGKDAAMIAQRFTDVLHIPYVLGFACSGALLSAAPIYEKSKTIAMTSSASAPAISQSGDYIFRTWPSDIAAAQKLFEYISKRYKRIGILNEQTEYPQGFYKAFKDANKDSSVTVINQDFLTDTTDFRSILLKFKSQKVEALIFNTQTEITFLAAYKQFKEMGFDTPPYGVLMPGSPTFLASAKDLANGIVYVDLPFPQEMLTKENAHLLDEFNQEYGGIKSLPVMFLSTFESMRALHMAIESGTDVRDFLYKTTFHGIFGDWHFDKNGDIQGLSPVMRIIEDQKSKRLPD